MSRKTTPPSNFKQFIFKGNALSKGEIAHVQAKCAEISEEVALLTDVGLSVTSLADVYGSKNGHTPILDALMPVRDGKRIPLSWIGGFVAHFLEDAPASKAALAKSIASTRRSNGGNRGNQYGDRLLRLLTPTSGGAIKLTLREEQQALIATSKDEGWEPSKLHAEIKKLRARHQVTKKK